MIGMAEGASAQSLVSTRALLQRYQQPSERPGHRPFLRLLWFAGLGAVGEHLIRVLWPPGNSPGWMQMPSFTVPDCPCHRRRRRGGLRTPSRV